MSDKLNATLKLQQPPYSIRISSPINSEWLGDFTEKDNLLTFNGNVDEAGRVFVDFICAQFNGRMKDYAEKQMVSFGNYLLSAERKAKFPVDFEYIGCVNDIDLEWIINNTVR